MHEEAQQLVRKASQVKNRAANGRLVGKATRYMTHGEKASKQEELDRIKDTLSPNNIALASLTQEGRANLIRYKNFLQQDLDENSAPEVSPAARDDLVRVERELAESIRAGMLPHEVMRRNPPGSVSHHIKWEREQKANILTWKNLRRMNNPDDDSEDLANVEILRPSVALPGAAATFMPDAQIPGAFAMTPAAKEKFDEIFPESPTIRTPMKAAEERENAELEAARKRIADLESQNGDLSRQLKKASMNDSPKSYRLWTCDMIDPLKQDRFPDEPEKQICGEEMKVFKKGVHIAKHKRDAKALADARKALAELQAKNAAAEQATVTGI